MKTRRILIPVNPERDSASALLFVRGMAAESPLHVTLVHAINLNVMMFDRRVFDELCSASEKLLRGLAEHIFGDARAVDVSVRVGKPHEAIVAEAAKGRADLIVLSKPRAARWKTLFGAGTTEHVVRNAPCPTLVLPRASKPRKFRDACRRATTDRVPAGLEQTAPVTAGP
jgi:nucleotide-binding universal stress UspA family protein